MTSKARFNQPSAGSGSNSKPVNTRASVGASGLIAGTKKGAAAPAGGPLAPAGKSNKVQVIFNGKIVTPQSLLPRNSAGHGHGDQLGKKTKAVNIKPQTIDEGGSENADKVSTHLTSKLSTKRPDPSGDSRMSSSKFSMAFKQKVVVEESVTLFLQETPTLCLLHIPSFVVASDTRDVIHTDERNARYEQAVKAHRNVDGFTSRPTQTKNNPLKNQNEMAAPNAYREVGSQAISYEIKDETASTTSGVVESDYPPLSSSSVPEDFAGFSVHVQKFVTDTVSIAAVTPGCLLDTTTAIRPPGPGEGRDGGEKKKERKGPRSMVSMNRLGSALNINNSLSEALTSDDEAGGAAGAGAKPPPSNTSSGNNSASEVGNKGASGSKVSLSQAGGESGAQGGGGGGEEGYVNFTEEDSLQVIREAEVERVLSSPLLLKRLQMMERGIVQNAQHSNQLEYRDLPDIPALSLVGEKGGEKGGEGGFGGAGKATLGGRGRGSFGTMGAGAGGERRGTSFQDPAHDNVSVHSTDDHSTSGVGENGGPSPLKGGPGGRAGGTGGPLSSSLSSEKIKKLFTFRSASLVGARAVTSLCWSKASPDLLAVGYGRGAEPAPPASLSSEEGESGGLVLFWSLRNPEYPEKILRLGEGVTCLSFSTLSPSLLAVGLAGGEIAIFDTKREGEAWHTPLESSGGQGHLSPVSQVEWVVKGGEGGARGEVLVSISPDGRVLEWNLKKGLVVSTLMLLKKSGTGEGWVSSSSSGLCFDFSPLDPSTYITGSEDGGLFRCSVSYSEQYLEAFSPHSGPVHKIRFSPRFPSLFLTCSADWSLSLYHLNFKGELLRMRGTGSMSPIRDVCWCPQNSTVFACVTQEARLQIWDFSSSAIDPLCVLDVGGEEDGGLGAGGAGGGAGGAGGEDGEGKEREEEGGYRPPHSSGKDTGGPSGAGAGGQSVEGGAPVAKLLHNLSLPSPKRSLTSVLFGERTPVVVVGDDRGAVFVYRVFDPPLVTLLGPLQQFRKLKEAVLRQCDPSLSEVLRGEEFFAPGGEEIM